MSTPRTIYYAVTFTLPYEGYQLTTQSVATSTTWLTASNQEIQIHYDYTNLFASPSTTAFATSFQFTDDRTTETSLGTNLQNIIINGSTVLTALSAPAVATTDETGANIASNATATSGPETSNANGTAAVLREHEGVMTGEAVSIGIGCAAVGALLASLVACLLIRRRSRRRAYSVATISSSSDSAKDSDKVAATPLSSIPLTGLSSALPQPEDDRTIIANVSKLGTVIKNHAQSFYAHSATIQFSGDALSKLEKLLYNCTDINAQDLYNMLLDLDTRIGAVRSLLAWSIVSNVGYNSQVDHTLLPPALAECLSAMKLEKDSSPDRLALLSKWRDLTGALMPPSKTMSSEDPRHFNISQLAKDLDDVLRFYASSDNKERFANMTEIIKQGAYVGYVLFVQPTTWAFEWGQGGDSELVVFPALVQLSDEHGRPRAKPLRSTSKQRVSIGKT